MNLLDYFGGMDPSALLQNLGPSLLTNPQIPTPPLQIGQVDPGQSQAAAAQQAAMNQGVSNSLTSPTMGQPTLDQLLAQQSQKYAPVAGGAFTQKLLDAFAPIPGPYKQFLSPQDQRAMQLRAIAQIGAGLTGAYTRPGESQYFGQNLARGMGAAQQGLEGALGPTQQALQTETQGVGLQGLMMRQQALQALAQLPAPPQGASPADMLAYHGRRMAIENSMGLAPEAQADARAMGVYQRMIDAGVKKAEDLPKQVSTGTAETIYDPKGHPDAPYLKPGQDPKDPDSWTSSLPRGMTADAQAQYKDRQQMQVADKFRTDKENAQDVTNAKVGNRLLDAIHAAQAGDKVEAAQIPILLGRLVHEGNVGRIGIIKQVTPLDESLIGRLSAAISKASTGLPPLNQLQDLEKSVRMLVGESAKEYTRRYKKVLPYAGTYGSMIDAPEDIFTGLTPAAPAPSTITLNPNATYKP